MENEILAISSTVKKIESSTNLIGMSDRPKTPKSPMIKMKDALIRSLKENVRILREENQILSDKNDDLHKDITKIYAKKNQQVSNLRELIIRSELRSRALETRTLFNSSSNLPQSKSSAGLLEVITRGVEMKFETPPPKQPIKKPKNDSKRNNVQKTEDKQDKPRKLKKAGSRAKFSRGKIPLKRQRTRPSMKRTGSDTMLDHLKNMKNEVEDFTEHKFLRVVPKKDGTAQTKIELGEMAEIQDLLEKNTKLEKENKEVIEQNGTLMKKLVETDVVVNELRMKNAELKTENEELLLENKTNRHVLKKNAKTIEEQLKEIERMRKRVRYFPKLKEEREKEKDEKEKEKEREVERMKKKRIKDLERRKRIDINKCRTMGPPPKAEPAVKLKKMKRKKSGSIRSQLERRAVRSMEDDLAGQYEYSSHLQGQGEGMGSTDGQMMRVGRGHQSGQGPRRKLHGRKERFDPRSMFQKSLSEEDLLSGMNIKHGKQGEIMGLGVVNLDSNMAFRVAKQGRTKSVSPGSGAKSPSEDLIRRTDNMNLKLPAKLKMGRRKSYSEENSPSSHKMNSMGILGRDGRPSAYHQDHNQSRRRVNYFRKNFPAKRLGGGGNRHFFQGGRISNDSPSPTRISDPFKSLPVALLKTKKVESIPSHAKHLRGGGDLRVKRMVAPQKMGKPKVYHRKPSHGAHRIPVRGPQYFQLKNQGNSSLPRREIRQYIQFSKKLSHLDK